MKRTMQRILMIVIVSFAAVICMGFTNNQSSFASDDDYDRVINSPIVSENSKSSVILPWDSVLEWFDNGYLRFKPSTDGMYEFFLYNSYGTQNASDLYFLVYPSADDAYLNQNSLTEETGEYLLSDAADWEIYSLKKGKTYCIKIVSWSDNSAYSTYQFMIKKHSHVWVNEWLDKGSFDMTGDTYWRCKCGATKSETYPMLSKVILSKGAYTYSGKACKPKVTIKDTNGKTVASSNYSVSYSNNKKVGKAKVTITCKGNYEGKATKVFKINPKGTTLVKVIKAKKAFTVKWKKQATQTTGYQIQYSLKSGFKSGNKTVSVKGTNTVSKKIKNLKAKKKYYVRVRTYKTVSGVKYYSAWSKSKIVTTK